MYVQQWNKSSTTSMYVYILLYMYNLDSYILYVNVLSKGVGSCSALGGTVHYQDTISMEKIRFLWS